MTHLPNAEVFTPRDSSSIDAWAAWFYSFLSENLSDGDLPPIRAEGKGSRPDLRGDGYLTDIAWEAQVLKQCRSHRPSDAGSVPWPWISSRSSRCFNTLANFSDVLALGPTITTKSCCQGSMTASGSSFATQGVQKRADRSLDGEPENR